MANKPKQEYENDVYIGITQPVRVLFPPKLAEAVKIGGKGDDKFEITIGFPADHPDYTRMYDICAALAAKKFGAETDIDEEFGLKFKSGDDEYEFYANHKVEEKRREYTQLQDMIIMKLRSKDEIGIFDTRRRGPDGNPIKITDKQEIRDTIYGGCYVSLRLTFATYDEIAQGRGKEPVPPGVTAFPEQVCFVSDGDRLGGGKSDSGQGFAQVQGAVSAEDPTGATEE